MTMIDETHDPARTSWVASANGHADFPIQNLPMGVFSTGIPEDKRIGVAIGDQIIDLRALAKSGLLDRHWTLALSLESLNAWFDHSRADARALRHRLSDLLSDEQHRAKVETMLVPQAKATMHLPCHIGDYTDFYVGIHHATNVGKLFRPDNPLLPNYKYVPIGYHGRASSIRLSGTDVIRPKGQRKPPNADVPDYGPCRRLDYELELGIFIGRGNALGQTIGIGEAADHIAGYCLLNDWSARDLQAWEYQPLGPFLAKNFLSSISAWVVTPEALAPFRGAVMARPEGDPAPLPYLFDAADQAEGALDIELAVTLSTKAMRDAGAEPHPLSKGDARSAMYWSAAQIVTHHASNGCNLQSGDLLGTGTLSMLEPSGFGSLLEISDGGKAPITLGSGETRTFLEDGDELTLRARCVRDGAVSIGFGSCSGIVQPAT